MAVPLTRRPIATRQRAFAGVVRLLHIAAQQASVAAALESPYPGFHGLHACEMRAAADQAVVALGPGDCSDLPNPIETDPVLLLRAAKALLRSEPASDFPAGTAEVTDVVIRLLGDAEYLAEQ